jgi:hypothetical protein
MNITEQLVKYVGVLIIVLIGILIIIYLYDQLTGANVVKLMVCGALYMIPFFGSLFTTLTQACAAIPA